MFNFSFKLPGKLADLEAKLAGVNGYTGRGEIEFECWKDGHRCLEVELRGVAGQRAEVFADNELVVELEFDHGRYDNTFHTRYGDAIPELAEGTMIEVRQNGDAILAGVLVAD